MNKLRRIDNEMNELIDSLKKKFKTNINKELSDPTATRILARTYKAYINHKPPTINIIFRKAGRPSLPNFSDDFI